MPKPIVHTADVLIIGGGFSGMWAAIRAAQQGRSVLVVDKGPRDWRGLGMVSGGDMIVMQPEFNVKDLLDELVYYYDGLCDQEQLAVILEASYDRFRMFPSAAFRSCAITSITPTARGASIPRTPCRPK